MSVSEEALAQKLSKLNETQESIQTLSQWFIFHRKRADQLAAMFLKEFVSALPERKLTLLYVVNDVLQESRGKGPEYIKAFAPHLGAFFADFYSKVNGELATKGDRLLGIWEQRSVYPGDFLAPIRQIRHGPVTAPVPSAQPSTLPRIEDPRIQSIISNLSRVPPDALILIEKLSVAGVMDKQISSERKDFPELEPNYAEPLDDEARKPFESRQHLDRINQFDSLLDSRMELSSELMAILDKMRSDEAALAKKYDDDGFALDDVWSRWFANDAQNNTVVKLDPTVIVEKAATVIEYDLTKAQEGEEDEYDPLAGMEEDEERKAKKPRLF